MGVGSCSLELGVAVQKWEEKKGHHAPFVSKFYDPDIMSATKTTVCQTMQDPPCCDISKKKKNTPYSDTTLLLWPCFWFYQKPTAPPIPGATDCFFLSS